MTQSVGKTPISFSFLPQPPGPATLAAPAVGALATGEQVSFSKAADSKSAVPTRHRTMVEQLQDIGQVKKGGGLLSKVWNWMNKPRVEAVRDVGGALLHNAPNLLVHASQTSKAVGDVAVAGELATAGTAAAGRGMGKALSVAGSSGTMAVLAKVGAVTGSVDGIMRLLRDLVRGRHGSERKSDQGMIVTGGFLAVTGSVIAILGGGLPAIVLGLTGTLLHATGLWRKAGVDARDAKLAAATAAPTATASAPETQPNQ